MLMETWSSLGFRMKTSISASLSTSGRFWGVFLNDMKPPYSREVTGYVLISHVDVRKIVLPSLQIVRGRTLFKLNVQDDEFALIVTLSKMHNLEMPALRGNSPAFPSPHPPSPHSSFSWDQPVPREYSVSAAARLNSTPPLSHRTCRPASNHEGWLSKNLKIKR